MAAPRLKACPCCRSTDVGFIQPTPERWFACCNSCDFRNRPDFESREAAAERWNDRAPPKKGRAGR